MTTNVTIKAKPPMPFRKLFTSWQLYVILIPALAWYILFFYAPLYGLQIAFKDYTIFKGFAGSPFVGLKHFIRFFNSYEFWSLIKNTLLLSLFNLLIGTPICLILAIMINEVNNTAFKKFVQTITYAPHFISTVVIVSMMISLLSPSSGFLAKIFQNFGFPSTDLFGSADYFRPLYIVSEIWQHTGWWSILFIAVLVSVDPQLHEAARIDGANKLQRIWHIEIPELMPTLSIVTILNLGGLMNLGFQKVLLMQTPLNMDTSSIISTYVYQVGMLGSQYSYTSAIGLFNGGLNFLLLIVANYFARKSSGLALW